MIWFNIYQYAFVQAVNDPRTFTGRVLIWRALMNFIGDHFWLGTGYGSFWNVGDDGPIYRYASGWVTRISEGHNGYLDLACQLGVPLAAGAGAAAGLALCAADAQPAKPGAARRAAAGAAGGVRGAQHDRKQLSGARFGGGIRADAGDRADLADYRADPPAAQRVEQAGTGARRSSSSRRRRGGDW
jgi:hypothetical protein